MRKTTYNFVIEDWKAPTNDGGRPIQGYTVEMYDLPTGNWIQVTQTEGLRKIR